MAMALPWALRACSPATGGIMRQTGLVCASRAHVGSADAGMLDEALLTQDAAAITSTVARLPTSAVLPFTKAVLYRVQVEAPPIRVHFSILRMP